MHLPIRTALLLASLVAAPASAAELTVHVRGENAQEGDLYAAVYDGPDTFLADGASMTSVRQRMSGAAGTARFADMPAGRYAVSVYVDTNGNGELDTNLIGRPTEPYGFSRDARGSLGAPGFEDAAVTVNDDTTLTINLR
ncbi:DUF2141 domain-containing protein [Ectothiorhodospiraceae bacterium WFHF3C12]|nr:DUF2141 domain-containing protein [Ectothiorhodospiraceae bacterium WFHF3C12]